MHQQDYACDPTRRDPKRATWWTNLLPAQRAQPTTTLQLDEATLENFAATARASSPRRAGAVKPDDDKLATNAFRSGARCWRAERGVFLTRAKQVELPIGCQLRPGPPPELDYRRQQLARGPERAFKANANPAGQWRHLRVDLLPPTQSVS